VVAGGSNDCAQLIVSGVHAHAMQFRETPARANVPLPLRARKSTPTPLCSSSLFGHVGKLPEGSIAPLGLLVFDISDISSNVISNNLFHRDADESEDGWRLAGLLLACKYLMHGDRAMASYKARDAI